MPSTSTHWESYAKSKTHHDRNGRELEFYTAPQTTHPKEFNKERLQTLKEYMPGRMKRTAWTKSSRRRPRRIQRPAVFLVCVDI